MPTSLEHLLPAPDQAVRCAEHARSIQVDPCGTALRADRIVLVPTPAPWPKPALAHPLLADLAERLAGGPVPTRLLATVPAPAGDGAVVVYDRTGGSARERRFALGDQSGHRLAALGRLLAPRPDDPALDHPEPIEEHRSPRPAVLICTQGSHDVCCGSEGTRFAETVEALRGVPGGLPTDLAVYRVSHTGGHRFAPTAMTLPDGRMWAGLDAETLVAILRRTAAVERLAPRCRGWWGAEAGAAQAAERAVFEEVGWDLDHRTRTVDPIQGSGPTGPTPGAAPSGRSELFVVTVDRDRWRVEVEQGREVPTIACRAPGGLPAKPAREYRVVAVDRLPG